MEMRSVIDVARSTLLRSRKPCRTRPLAGLVGPLIEKVLSPAQPGGGQRDEGDSLGRAGDVAGRVEDEVGGSAGDDDRPAGDVEDRLARLGRERARHVDDEVARPGVAEIAIGGADDEQAVALDREVGRQGGRLERALQPVEREAGGQRRRAELAE